LTPRFERFAPVAERLGVVNAQYFDIGAHQPRTLDRRHDLRQGRTVRARENILADKRVDGGRRIESSDGMDDRNTIICEQILQLAEVFLINFLAHIFEHPDGDDPVEFLRKFAVFLQSKPDPAIDPGGLCAFIQELVLFGRQCHPGNVGTRHIREIQTQSAPARPDIENFQIVPIEQQLVCEVPFLVELGGFQVFFRIREIRARILMVFIEKQLIQICRQIVMMRNVLLREVDRIVLLEFFTADANPPENPDQRKVLDVVIINRGDFHEIEQRAVFIQNIAVHKGFCDR
jgi:hypothetical protein